MFSCLIYVCGVFSPKFRKAVSEIRSNGNGVKVIYDSDSE